MKNYALPLLLIALYHYSYTQSLLPKALINTQVKNNYNFECLEKVKSQLAVMDSFKYISVNEYYKKNAEMIDCLSREIEAQVRVQHLTKINQCLSQIVESTDVSQSETMADLESVVFNADKDLHNIVDLLKKISASFRFQERTQNNMSLLPIKNRYDAYAYDQKKGKVSQSKFLNQTKFSLSPDDMQYSIFSEVYTDYFGFVKFSLGSVLTSGQVNSEMNIAHKENDDSLSIMPSSTIINKLTSGGGNLVLTVNTPICIYVNDRLNFRYATTLQNRVALDVPLNATTLKGYPINVEPSIVNSIYFGGMNDILALTIDIKLARIYGNERFYELLARQCKGSFFLNQFSFGVQVNKKFNFGINFFLGDDYVKQNFPSTLALGLVF